MCTSTRRRALLSARLVALATIGIPCDRRTTAHRRRSPPTGTAPVPFDHRRPGHGPAVERRSLSIQTKSSRLAFRVGSPTAPRDHFVVPSGLRCAYLDKQLDRSLFDARPANWTRSVVTSTYPAPFPSAPGHADRCRAGISVHVASPAATADGYLVHPPPVRSQRARAPRRSSAVPIRGPCHPRPRPVASPTWPLPRQAAWPRAARRAPVPASVHAVLHSVCTLLSESNADAT